MLPREGKGDQLRSISRTPWPAACWTKNGIQVTQVSWPDPMVGQEKSQMIGYRPFSAKMIPFHQRKFGKESSVWEQKSAWKDMLTYSQTLGGPLPTKRIFSSGQTLATDRRQFSQASGKSPVKRVEQNLWTEVSRKGADSADSGGCHSPVKERNLKIKLDKDKYNLNYFPSTLPKYWNYMYSKKKEKLKGFCFINSKWGNELCYMLQLSDLGIFSSKRKKKEKEKEEKDCWETFMFDTACWLNIAGFFKKKRKKKEELFLKSYLFGCRLLKLCYIFNAPLCRNLLVVLFIYRVAFFCTYLFQLRITFINSR